MKRIEKGTPGYLDYKKKVEIIRTVIYFLLVAAIFTLGYVQTKTRSNLLTVVAILGCLPAAKALVGVITRFPYASVVRSCMFALCPFPFRFKVPVSLISSFLSRRCLCFSSFSMIFYLLFSIFRSVLGQPDTLVFDQPPLFIRKMMIFHAKMVWMPLVYIHTILN